MNKFFNWLRSWVAPDMEQKAEEYITVRTERLSFTASFDDERSMRLARTIIDDVITSRYEGV